MPSGHSTGQGYMPVSAEGQPSPHMHEKRAVSPPQVERIIITNCTIVTNLFKQIGVVGSENYYATKIVFKESSCNHRIVNPTSGAYGLPQALPGNKMASHGADWRENPTTQLRWMIDYVNGRYGTFENAYNFQLANGWY